jgi:hypothetical protein
MTSTAGLAFDSESQFLFDYIKLLGESQARVDLSEISLACRELRLTSALNYVIDKNTGRANPYHNTRHCIGVAVLALVLATRIRANAGSKHNIMDFGYSETRGLVLGCLFHDFGHTAADVPDKENIDIAIDGLSEFARTLGNSDMECELEIAKGCIAITEYPYVEEPRTITQKIIRDADLLYATFAPDGALILKGLHDELKNKEAFKNVSLPDFLRSNEKFVSGIKWYTDEARDLFECVVENAFAQNHMVAKLLEASDE